MRLAICWILLPISLTLVVRIEAISLITKSEYNSSNIMDVYFLFEADAVVDNLTFVLSALEGPFNTRYLSVVAMECEVSYDEDDKLDPKGFPGLMAIDPNAASFSLLRIPAAIFKQNQYTNDVLRVEMKIVHDTSVVATTNTTLRYQKPSSLQGTRITVYQNNYTRLYPTLANNGTPIVYINNQIKIKVTPVSQNYTYKMVLHNFHDPKRLCTFEHLSGKIDLSAFNSLNAIHPHEVDMTATEIVLAPYMMPHGLIRISVLTMDQGDSKYEYGAFLEVRRNLSLRDLPFHTSMEPWADAIWWIANTDINIKTTEAFFPSLKPYYGFSKDMSSQVQFRVQCISGSTCNFTQADNLIHLDKQYVNSLLNFKMTWTYGNIGEMQSRHAAILKDFRIGSNRLQVDIECVQNCRRLIKPAVALILRAKCYNCDWKKMHYSWIFEHLNDVGRGRFLYSKYLRLLGIPIEHLGDTFYLTLEVYEDYYLKGFARKQLWWAQDPQWAGSVHFSNETFAINTKRRGPYNTFHFNLVAYWAFRIRNDGEAPALRCITRDDGDPVRKVELCTVGSRMRNVAMYFSGQPQWNTTAEIRFGGETVYSTKDLTSVVEDRNYIDSGLSIIGKCNLVSDSQTYGLSAEFALAQEIYTGVFTDDEIGDCFELIESKLKVETIHPARYKYSFKIQYMFFMARGRNHSEPLKMMKYLDHMFLTRRRILDTYLLRSQELQNLAKWTITAANQLLDNIPAVRDPQATQTKVDLTKNKELEITLHHFIVDAALDMLKLDYRIANTLRFRFAKRLVFMLWNKAAYQGTLHFSYYSSEFNTRISIPKSVFDDTFSFYGRHGSEEIVQDDFVNLVGIISDTVYRNNPAHPLNHGSVLLFAQAKTTEKLLQLRPVKNPIKLEFTRKSHQLDKVKEHDVRILKENGAVVDSTCVIFSVLQNDQINLTLYISSSGGQNYEVAKVEAKYPREYLKFVGSKFLQIPRKYSYFLPKVSERYKFDHPHSQVFFLVRAIPSGQKIRNQSAVVESNDTISVSIKGAQCFVMVDNKWSTNKLCKHKWSYRAGTMGCDCLMHAPFSARSGSALDYYKEFVAQKVRYNKPDYVPASFIFIWVVPFIFYCYWAVFQDRRERDCDKIHVVRNMYRAESEEQFLVCVCTGSLPGSGTNCRVSFLLVGEFGSHQTVQPEGRFRFSTGSEIWFLVSSDLRLGRIVGITLQYDRINKDSELTPWLVKKVLLYSSRNNHVIEFNANRTMGLHLRTMVLPSIPNKNNGVTEEMLQRFWQLLKTYHLFGSVLFQVPGRGVSKVLNALGTMAVVAVSSSIAVEVLGPPFPVYIGKAKKTFNLDKVFIRQILILSGVTFGLSILVKATYVVAFRKGIKAIWYDKPQPVDGFWQGGADYPSWQKMSIFTSLKKVRNYRRSWLSDKKPLTRRPVVKPKWEIGKEYFSQAKSLFDNLGLFSRSTKTPETPKGKTAARQLQLTRDYLDKLPEPEEMNVTFFRSKNTKKSDRSNVSSIDSLESGNLRLSKAQTSTTAFASHQLEFSDAESFFVVGKTSNTSIRTGLGKSASKFSIATSISAGSERSTAPKRQQKDKKVVKILDENKNRGDSSPVNEGDNEDGAIDRTFPKQEDARVEYFRKAAVDKPPAAPVDGPTRSTHQRFQGGELIPNTTSKSLDETIDFLNTPQLRSCIAHNSQESHLKGHFPSTAEGSNVQDMAGRNLRRSELQDNPHRNSHGFEHRPITPCSSDTSTPSDALIQSVVEAGLPSVFPDNYPAQKLRDFPPTTFVNADLRCESMCSTLKPEQKHDNKFHNSFPGCLLQDMQNIRSFDDSKPVEYIENSPTTCSLLESDIWEPASDTNATSDAELSTICFSDECPNMQNLDLDYSEYKFGFLRDFDQSARENLLLYGKSKPNSCSRSVEQNISTDQSSGDPDSELMSMKLESSDAACKRDTRHHKGVTTFHEYYFESALVNRILRTQKWFTEPPNQNNCRFLRDARYLEKMVRDYSLDNFNVKKQCADFMDLESNDNVTRKGKCSNRWENGVQTDVKFEEDFKKWIGKELDSESLNENSTSLYLAGSESQILHGKRKANSTGSDSFYFQRRYQAITPFCKCCQNFIIKLGVFLAFLKSCLLCEPSHRDTKESSGTFSRFTDLEQNSPIPEIAPDAKNSDASQLCSRTNDSKLMTLGNGQDCPHSSTVDLIKQDNDALDPPREDSMHYSIRTNALYSMTSSAAQRISQDPSISPTLVQEAKLNEVSLSSIHALEKKDTDSHSTQSIPSKYHASRDSSKHANVVESDETELLSPIATLSTPSSASVPRNRESNQKTGNRSSQLNAEENSNQGALFKSPNSHSLGTAIRSGQGKTPENCNQSALFKAPSGHNFVTGIKSGQWEAKGNCNQSALFKTQSGHSLGTQHTGSSASESSYGSLNVQLSAHEHPIGTFVDTPKTHGVKFEYFSHEMRPVMERWMKETTKDGQGSKNILTHKDWLSWTSHHCRNFVDLWYSFWTVKVHFLKIPIVVISVFAIIFSTGWVSANGRYYSKREVVHWLTVVAYVLLVETLVVEPCIYIVYAAISTQVWRTPVALDECVWRFTNATRDVDYKQWMVELCLSGRFKTSAIHTQAAPESISLFHLHNKIFKALKQRSLPNVTFESGVYWLIFYTACTLTLVNVQTNIYLSNMQSQYISGALGLSTEKRPISVQEMWHYIENDFQPSLMSMNVNYSKGIGSMMFSPVRFRQIRNTPAVDVRKVTEAHCSPLRAIRISPWRQCNFEFSRDRMETRNFSSTWIWPRVRGIIYLDPDKASKKYQFYEETDNPHPYHTIDFLPPSGYQTILHFDDASISKDLERIRNSDWIDQHTRYLIIDFSLLNRDSYIMSNIRIRFDFMRMATFWHSTSSHFLYEVSGNTYVFIVVLSCAFIFILAYNTIMEAYLIYKTGVLGYFSLLSSYIELAKVILSVWICVVRIQRRTLAFELLRKLKYYKTVRKTDEFLDFHVMAALDYNFTMLGGVLGFLCIFHVFLKLSKIRRLLIFLKLLKSVIALFWLPLLVGLAFTFLAQLLFNSTHKDFVYFGRGFLTILQYFIKPRAIYASLTADNPYLAPCFYLILGVFINIFILNFFIVFLNESYSATLNKVRMETYKLKEKTSLEYAYEFLGIRSTISWDEEGDSQKERSADRAMLKDVKRLVAH